MEESTRALISLRRVSRHFQTGRTKVGALKNVNLDICPGEFVAVMGPSGSGKTTLMNILGCLDRPSAGDYFFQGQPLHEADANERARLRREVFGFVFQNYNLLPNASARENVETPAIYAGLRKRARDARATRLLSELGLSRRLDHRPGQLSGGEQQRVAIARALMNGCQVVLADEPTGSLDSQSGREIMEQLRSLAKQGRTVVVITHDPNVASYAVRQIELLDGRVVTDRSTSEQSCEAVAIAMEENGPAKVAGNTSVNRILTPAVAAAESMRSAFRALSANKFRTALTLLGIVIGVLSVTAMLGIAEGVRRDILETLQDLGGSKLTIQRAPGRQGSPLTLDDAEAIRLQVPNLALVSPQLVGGGAVSAGQEDQYVTIIATTAAALKGENLPLAQGVLFTEQQDNSFESVVVLGATVATNLFDENSTPVGEYVLIGDGLFRVIGVLKPGNSPYSPQSRSVYMPFMTGALRFHGSDELDIIEITVAETQQLEHIENAIQSLLTQRHGGTDFQIANQAQLLEAQETATGILRLMFGAIGGISLIVAGIGVMNIMLASVAERTREIGVRMATGARQRDILMQFVCEAIVVSGLGGLTGLMLALAVGALLSSFDQFQVVFTLPILLVGLSCSLLTGLLFGFAPARRAARLDPVAAIAAQ